MEKAFVMLAELLRQEQFELILSDTDIRLVYLMNDAVESFLVFKDAKMTGKYIKDYDGMLEAALSKERETYILTVWQGDQAVTLFFKDLELEVHLYEYGNIAHFWVPGYEYLRLLEYQLAILRDKIAYLGEDYCTDTEKQLVHLADFPPLNYTSYPSVPEKYLVPRKCHGRWMTKKIAGMLCQMEHQSLINLISEKIHEGTKDYPRRIFEDNINDEFNHRLKKAQKRQKEMETHGIRATVYREEPFTTAKDSLDFHVYLMIDENSEKDRHVRIQEVK